MSQSQTRIAFCFYGQPRNYQKGYEDVKRFLEKNKLIKFDFFFHAWKIPNNSSYQHSLHRPITKEELYVTNSEQILDDLTNFYKPVSYEYENSKVFDIDQHKDSLLYQNSINIKQSKLDAYKQELQALYSLTYSKNKVRKLLQDYVNKTNQTYDSVILTRFDCYDHFSIQQYHIESLDYTKSYVIKMHYPRLIIPDMFVLCPLNVFLKWFNIYENYNNLINNHVLNEYFKHINEHYYFNAEAITLANYIYYFHDTSNISYSL